MYDVEVRNCRDLYGSLGTLERVGEERQRLNFPRKYLSPSVDTAFPEILLPPPMSIFNVC